MSDIENRIEKFLAEFDVEEIIAVLNRLYPDMLVFDDEIDAENYCVERGLLVDDTDLWLVPDDSDGQLRLCAELAENLSTSDLLSEMTDRDQFAYDVIDAQGWTTGADCSMIEAFHDDEEHTGAVSYCTHPFCETYSEGD